MLDYYVICCPSNKLKLTGKHLPERVGDIKLYHLQLLAKLLIVFFTKLLTMSSKNSSYHYSVADSDLIACIVLLLCLAFPTVSITNQKKHPPTHPVVDLLFILLGGSAIPDVQAYQLHCACFAGYACFRNWDRVQDCYL